ncbi:hypothetical protein [Thalassotalea litorea]|uniref:hypothetical protein n=1 Tax=Thalassotalea litorea TaxID=2020715 RepID=UPI003736BD50
MQIVSLANKQLSLFVEEEKGLLYCATTQTLHKLQSSSIAILLAIDLGFDESQCLIEVSRLGGVSKKDIIASYRVVSDIYESSKDVNHYPSEIQTTQAETYSDGLYPEIKNIPYQPLNPLFTDSGNKDEFVEPLCIEIGAVGFKLFIEQQKLRNVLAALLEPVLLTRELSSQSVMMEFVVRNYRKTYEVANDCNACEVELFEFVSNSQVIESKLAFNQVAPVLIERMQILTFQSTPFRFCFHGAALSKGEHVFLLPGKSGVGKSTLTSYLAKRGFFVHSDEMIAFNDEFQPLTIPMPIAIKRGAWQQVRAEYPHITQQPVWHLKDGRQVKYVWPDCDGFIEPKPVVSNAQPQTLHFIAPNFTPDQDLKANPHHPQQPLITPLTVIDTIELMTQGGYQVGKELAFADVMAIVTLFSKSSCETLTYTSSKMAYRRFEQILAR